MTLKVDDLFPIAEALQIRGFAELADGDLLLTPEDSACANSDMRGRKTMFASHLKRHVPLIEHIKQVLDERPGHRAPLIRFLSELEDHLSGKAANEVLRTAITWGRYAELFSHDSNTGMLSFDDPAF
jgi:NitT/TauT family transport system ATP-binding protein